MCMMIQNKMTHIRRELMHKVLADQITSNKIIYYLYSFDRLTWCDELLRWLINSNLVGKNFLSYIEENDLSPLELAKLGYRMIVRGNENRPIIFGKDFR